MVQGDETVNFGGQVVKDQGHTMPELDWKAWWRHLSPLFQSSRFSSL